MAGERLGRGNTAEVLAWEEGRVLKLFYPQYREKALLEYANARLIQKLPLPAVACYGMLEWEGRPGILYERADGPSLLGLLLEGGDAAHCGSTLAAVHRQVLGQRLPEGRSYKEILRSCILRAEQLSLPRRRQVLALLERIPEGEALCHGDLHFDNVLLAAGTPKIIDFMTLCRGDPQLDIARTVWMLAKAAPPDTLPAGPELEALRRRAVQSYLAEMDVAPASLREAMAVIAAGRLWELRHQPAECAAALAFLEEQRI